MYRADGRENDPDKSVYLFRYTLNATIKITICVIGILRLLYFEHLVVFFVQLNFQLDSTL